MTLVAYAWFHQGGGWNQNCRFNQVRSIVEAGCFHTNAYMSYVPYHDDAGNVHLKRFQYPVPFTPGNRPGEPWPNGGDPPASRAAFIPTSRPGATLLAVPAYWAASQIESRLGIDRDDYWPLNWNLHIVTVATVGLAGRSVTGFPVTPIAPAGSPTSLPPPTSPRL